jgi:hypothetical protein
MGIKRLFLKEDPENEKKASKKEKSVPVTQSQFHPQTGTLAPTITDGAPDDRFVKMLQDVIAANNIPGQDYFEFRQAIDAMASMSLDEKNKFLAAYIAGQYKKEVLFSSIDKYVSIIQNELKSFSNDLAAQYDERVNQKLAKVEQAKKELEAMNKKIIETNNLILTASQEAQQEELKLKMTESSFKKSVERVLATLNDDKQKINNYIQ